MLRAGSHGSQVPRPTHVSKSQHGGKVPTFEPQETITIRFVFIKVASLFYANNIITYIERWVWLFARPNSLHKPQISPPKSVAM